MVNVAHTVAAPARGFTTKSSRVTKHERIERWKRGYRYYMPEKLRSSRFKTSYTWSVRSYILKHRKEEKRG